MNLDSVRDLREQFAAGSVSARSVAEQALARTNSNASHNVYISLDADRVSSDAAELPDRFASNPKPLLYGLPISLKDCFDLKGFPTSCGSRYYAALRSEERRVGKECSS